MSDKSEGQGLGAYGEQLRLAVEAAEVGMREIERLNRLYATLSELNKALIRVTSPQELFLEVCRITVQHAGFKVVWIGQLDRETQRVLPVARAGDSGNYIDTINVYADDRPEGRGPTGTCIREARPCIFNHFLTDPRALPWRAAAAAHGLQAVAALPIRFGGEVFGFTVYAGEAGVFRDKEIALLGEIAASISFALESLEREAQRRRAEDALRESEARFRSYVEHAPIAVFVVDRQGRYVDFNPAALELLDYDAATLSSKSIPDIAADEDLGAAQDSFTRLVELGHFETEFRLKARDGRRVWVSLRSVKISEDRFMAYCHDITERKRAEAALVANAQLAGANEALVQAGRRKDEFLAMLAHELRNPLAPIRNAVQLLRQTCPKAEGARHHDTIERQVAHMARLLDDLLDVSRITHGKIDLRKRPLPVAGVLVHAVETASPLIQSRQHLLEWTPPPPDLCVEGDFDRLAQAVGNLLANAAKYTEVGGRIWLETSREDAEIIIRVRDTGVGIAPEMQTRIFELFTQADHSLARTQGGLGIGLTMARALVRMHGGSIEVASAGLGKGSEFSIRLPAFAGACPAMASPAAPSPSPSASQRVARHILVVDDVVDTAESMVELMESWGHTARVCYDGYSALEAVREYHPDVVLLDIGLPGMDGYAVARCLREEHGSTLRLIALTGYGQDSDQRQALAAGFDHHLVKPVDLSALAALLEQPL